MTDIALVWYELLFSGDIVVEGGAVTTDDGLRTAIAISLFSDARAGDDDDLPEPGADRRGWWGDAYPAETDDLSELGSKLWLLARSKATTDTLRKAQNYAHAALQWIVRDGIARSIEATVERQVIDGTECLAIGVVLDRPTGPARERYDFTWEASA